MGRPLKAGEHEEVAAQVFELSCQRYSQRAISKELGIARSTVSKMLAEQRQAYRRQKKEGVETALGGIDAAINEAFRRLRALPDASASNAGPGLLNALNSLWRTRCELLGQFPPKRTESKVAHVKSPDLSKLTDPEFEEYYANAQRQEELLKKALARPDDFQGMGVTEAPPYKENGADDDYYELFSIEGE